MTNPREDADQGPLSAIDTALAAVLKSGSEEAIDALGATGRAGLMRVLELYYPYRYHPTMPFADPLEGRSAHEHIDAWSEALSTVARANPGAFLDEIEAGHIPFDEQCHWSQLIRVIGCVEDLDDPRAAPLIERFRHHPEWLVGFNVTRSAAVNALLRTLTAFFADREDVRVACRTVLYDTPEKPVTRTSPDVFVAIGVPRLPVHSSYAVWREGVPPTVVLEVTAMTRRTSDRQKNVAAYARIGVQEQFICDPVFGHPAFDSWPDPPFLGYRLEGSGYRSIEPEADGSLRSIALGLRLQREEGRLALYDVRTGELLRPATAAES